MRELTKESRELIFEQQLQVKVGDVFLDLGCGRGLVLLEALERGCTTAVGVESNRNCLNMMEDVIRQRQWTVTQKIERDSVTSYLLMRNEQKATVYFVVGDLGSLTLEELSKRCDLTFGDNLRVYWYGTIMLREVKANVCQHIFNEMPAKARMVYVHLPWDFDVKTRDVLYQYGLIRKWKLCRESMVQGKYLQTVSDEEVATFLYVLDDDTACNICGSFDHQEWKRSEKRCPNGGGEHSSVHTRRENVLNARAREEKRVEQAFKKLRSEVLPDFKGRLKPEDLGGVVAGNTDDADDISLGSSKSSESEDPSEMSSEGSVETRYESDTEPTDPRLTLKGRLMAHARAVRAGNHAAGGTSASAASAAAASSAAPKRAPPSANAHVPQLRVSSPGDVDVVSGEADAALKRSRKSPPAPSRESPPAALESIDRSGRVATFRCSTCERTVEAQGWCRQCDQSLARSRAVIDVVASRAAVLKGEPPIPVLLKRSTGEWQYARIERTPNKDECRLIISRQSAGGTGEFVPNLQAGMRTLWSLLKEIKSEE